MKKRSYKNIRIIYGAFAVLLITGLLSACSVKNEITTGPEIIKTPAYLASADKTVPVYSLETDENGDEYFVLYDNPVRGTRVLDLNEVYSAKAPDGFISPESSDTPSDTSENGTGGGPETVPASGFGSEAGPETGSETPGAIGLSKIQFPDSLTDSEGGELFYFVIKEMLAADKEDIVKETAKWVRTPATAYKNITGPEIAGFEKKGTFLTVEGYDHLNSDGSVNKYKVSDPDGNIGWVHSKYLADDEASALAVNEPIYEIHKNRIYKDLELNGGDPANLDWYPFAKPALAKNSFCAEAKTMYLCAEACVNNEYYLELIKNSGANAVVIDIKDGQLAYRSEIAKAQCPSAYDTAFVTLEEYKNAVREFKDAGVYVIGRIVCFSDAYYAKDHPETCIDSPESYTAWPSAYSRDAWYYNVSLAVEAVKSMGFNEIQFDYVRFPENAYNMSKNPATDFKNTYGEDKAEAVQNFCMYAMDSIREAGAYFSVDVFGECADEYVTAYGQYWPAISQIVDAISGMPYTDHYGSSVDTWTAPYDIVYSFAEKAAKRQTEVETPAVARTWITGYNTPNWKPAVNYDEAKLEQQIKALYDAGLTGGFIPWNGGSNINKYYEYSGIWSKNYTGALDPQ